MWPVIIGFLVLVVAFTLMAYLFGKWASSYVQHDITSRLEAINAIVNDGRVPEAWLEKFRSRATKLVEVGASEEQIAQLGRIARKKCLANIQDLIKYIEKMGIADSEDTKKLMLRELRAQEQRWQDAATWDGLVDLTAPPVEEIAEWVHGEAKEEEVA